MSCNHLKKAVFLDRDGTLNVEREYLFKIEDLSYIPGAVEAVALLKSAGFLIVVVTNQSGIGRGLYSEPELDQLHAFMQKELEKSSAGIDAYYYCPHHPEYGKGDYLKECACRKPLPGMILQAATELGIDLASSWMIGDKLADVEAGLAAGCSPILVRTGYGSIEADLVPQEIPVVDDLSAAAGLILLEDRSLLTTDP